MQSLRERQNARQAQRKTSGHIDDQQHSNLNQATAFPSPLHATVDGEPVRVVAFGDLPGFSPAYLCVDKHGDSIWVSMEDTKIIDPNALPLQTQTTKDDALAGSYR